MTLFNTCLVKEFFFFFENRAGIFRMIQTVKFSFSVPTKLIFQLQLAQSSVLGQARRDLRDNSRHQTTLVLSSFIKSLLLIGLGWFSKLSWWVLTNWQLSNWEVQLKREIWWNSLELGWSDDENCFSNPFERGQELKIKPIGAEKWPRIRLANFQAKFPA
jgi:hypothetical protein